MNNKLKPCPVLATYPMYAKGIIEELCDTCPNRAPDPLERMCEEMGDALAACIKEMATCESCGAETDIVQLSEKAIIAYADMKKGIK